MCIFLEHDPLLNSFETTYSLEYFSSLSQKFLQLVLRTAVFREFRVVCFLLYVVVHICAFPQRHTFSASGETESLPIGPSIVSTFALIDPRFAARSKHNECSLHNLRPMSSLYRSLVSMLTCALDVFPEIDCYNPGSVFFQSVSVYRFCCTVKRQ